MTATIERMSHKVGGNFWHFEWCIKYRYKMMQKLENKNPVEAAIRKAARKHKISFQILKLLPEHVHMMATLPNGMTDSKAFQLLKGGSSYTIFRNKENFRLRYPNGQFCCGGFYAITVGPSDVQKYFENTNHNVLVNIVEQKTKDGKVLWLIKKILSNCAGG